MRRCCDCGVDAGWSGRVTGNSLSCQKKILGTKQIPQTRPRMSPTRDQPTLAPHTKSLAPHPYAHARGNKPSTRERVDALQARDDGYLNPHHHARRCEPPAKPTPEQTVALNKYHVAHKRYDEEYRDEVLIDMYKCMVRPLD